MCRNFSDHFLLFIDVECPDYLTFCHDSFQMSRFFISHIYSYIHHVVEITLVKEARSNCLTLWSGYKNAQNTDPNAEIDLQSNFSKPSYFSKKMSHI